MIRAFIVDDEKLAREGLISQLHSFQDVEIVGEAADAVAGIAGIKEFKPDVVFLDVSMPVTDGFRMLEQLSNPPYVIFTTAHANYALDAIRADAVDYLLKPIDGEDIRRALERLRRRTNTPEKTIQTLLKHITPVEKALPETPGSYRRKFLLREGSRFHPVTVEDIAYFFAEEKNVFVQLRDARRFVWDESLEKLGEQLDPAHFYRVNRQLVVAHAAITAVQVWFKGKLKLQLNPPFHREAVVSAEKASAFKTWLNQ
ncbi:MAG: LytTR family DNA-binding domain-containing protein [Bacteroidia bacterium]|jgi:DNA-binding LytR/AlgR family response regulator|nr:LytTR family DNA-binding domain-containing protein [Bacteroidia bacterium]